MSEIVGVGIDLVDVARFTRVLERRPALHQRLFTEGERTAARTERLAARFAAKEAVMKALGCGLGSVAFRDIEIVSEASGAPQVRLHATALVRASALGVNRWHLSLTHTEHSAGAVVIATA